MDVPLPSKHSSQVGYEPFCRVESNYTNTIRCLQPKLQSPDNEPLLLQTVIECDIKSHISKWTWTCLKCLLRCLRSISKSEESLETIFLFHLDKEPNSTRLSDKSFSVTECAKRHSSHILQVDIDKIVTSWKHFIQVRWRLKIMKDLAWQPKCSHPLEFTSLQWW